MTGAIQITQCFSRMRHCNFTLVEMLVVIAVIAILSSLLLPALRKAQEVAKGIPCMGNLRQINLGVINYANDFNGWTVGHYYNNFGQASLRAWNYQLCKETDYVAAKYAGGNLPNNSILRCPAEKGDIPT